ncbi:MAG: hypothetical protein COA70_07665 [Planctomycetota bacterium]|nr:MAG: hypothetical protein COA70_07665 [Planctomycetota bacterium]
MAFAFSAMASAQQSPLPTDAKSLLQKHSTWIGLSSTRRAEESLSLERAFVYLQAGAEGELREEVSNLTERHPDALRFAMQADCWNPANFRAGRDRADDWLQQFPNRAESETKFVESVRTYLGDAESRRDYVHERAGSSRWFPLGAGLLVLLIAAGAMRLLP